MKRNPQVTGVDEPQKVEKNPKKSLPKSAKIMLAGGILGMIAGVALVIAAILMPKGVATSTNFPKVPSEKQNNNIIYSKLTGEALADGAKVNAPAYCVQIPNGTDGARPQVGLTEAGVVFEAVAEAGITRFAAIYQDPSSAVIGPVRSLRIYYLEWDTPFDCTIVHAGGSGDALAAVARGGYKDLTENYTYMYRGNYSYRLWNNLFTTSAYLKQFSADRGYTTSEIKGFARMTPDEATAEKVKNTAVNPLQVTEATDKDTSAVAAKVSHVELKFGGWASFNVEYNYNATSNTYLRSYESGAAHEVYECAGKDLGEKNPEDVCTPAQVAPSVVVAIVVSEKRAADNYHEDVTVLGSGKAFIFQNGGVTTGTWKKNSDAEQIKFYDAAGAEILLAPGQTFVSAVPTYGSVVY